MQKLSKSMRSSKIHSSVSEMNDEWGNLEASWASLKARASIADHIYVVSKMSNKKKYISANIFIEE